MLKKTKLMPYDNRHIFISGRSAPDFAAEDYEVDFKNRSAFEDLTELGKRQMALNCSAHVIDAGCSKDAVQ